MKEFCHKPWYVPVMVIIGLVHGVNGGDHHGEGRQEPAWVWARSLYRKELLEGPWLWYTHPSHSLNLSTALTAVTAVNDMKIITPVFLWQSLRHWPPMSRFQKRVLPRFVLFLNVSSSPSVAPAPSARVLGSSPRDGGASGRVRGSRVPHIARLSSQK